MRALLLLTMVALTAAGCGRGPAAPPAKSAEGPPATQQTPAEPAPESSPDMVDQQPLKPRLHAGDVIRFPRGMIACRTKASLTDDVLMAGGGLAGCVSVQPSDKLKVVSVEYERDDPDSALMWVRSPALPFPKAFIVSADDSLWERAK